MKLKKLLKNFPELVIKGSRELEITGVCADSRRVAPGNLFIARKGTKHDGLHYIPMAISSGAVAILTDLYDPSLKQVTQIIAHDIATLEPLLAATYYQQPSQELLTIGITGTNGKTTTSFIVRYLLEKLQQRPCGLIGTIEYCVGNKSYQASHTTPDPCTLQKLLREICQNGGSSVVIEVTSHALDQKRCAEVEFDLAVFTNLTQDHLDYHQNMQDYALAKQALFSHLSDKRKNASSPAKCAIINVDDPSSSTMMAHCRVSILTYGIEKPADLVASAIVWQGHGTQCLFHFQENTYPVFVPLVGRFNLYNVLAATATLLAAGFSMENIIEALAHAPSIPGRLEIVPNPRNLQIFVDFAHTPDALQKALETLRPITSGRLITVFGCGGDRDRSKRPLMAAVCERHADLVVVTSDNPRSEEPQDIIREILAGFNIPEKAVVIAERKAAISEAISLAQAGDTVLIAGKGHEKYQILGTQALPFDDVAVAKNLSS